MYYGSALLLFTHKLHCRTVPVTVFEILAFKLKNDNDNNNKKNWRNELFAISPIIQGRTQSRALRALAPPLSSQLGQAPSNKQTMLIIVILGSVISARSYTHVSNGGCRAVCVAVDRYVVSTTLF